MKITKKKKRKEKERNGKKREGKLRHVKEVNDAADRHLCRATQCL